MIPFLCALTISPQLQTSELKPIPWINQHDQSSTSYPTPRFIGEKVINISDFKNGGWLVNSGRNGTVYRSTALNFGKVQGEIHSPSGVTKITHSTFKEHVIAIFPEGILTETPAQITEGQRLLGNANLDQGPPINYDTFLYTSKNTEGKLFRKFTGYFKIIPSVSLDLLAYYQETPGFPGQATTLIPSSKQRTEIQFPITNQKFVPMSLNKSGVVVGAIHSNRHSKKFNIISTIEPTYWKDGKFNTIPLPTKLESHLEHEVQNLNLLMEWNGAFLGESANFSTGLHLNIAWVYQNHTWINLQESNPDLPHSEISDYDLSTGRILLANKTHYKVIQL